jgi:dUTP pyrophosphatase
MKVKIKKLSELAVSPKYAQSGDAGMDLVAISETKCTEHGYVEFGTGIAVEIPEGYVGLVFPRSSISNIAHLLANSVGVIDSNYRGEIKVRMKPDTSSIMMGLSGLDKYFTSKYYNIGDKVAQLIILPYPKIEFEEVSELSNTERNDGGFGSTGS